MFQKAGGGKLRVGNPNSLEHPGGGMGCQSLKICFSV